VTRSIERAQRKVELNNFEIRKRLLEYDDVMNKQREVIYAMRLRALEGDAEEVYAEAREIIRDAAGDKIAHYLDPEGYSDAWDVAGLREDLMRTYLLPFAWLERLERGTAGEKAEADEDLPRTWDDIAERIQSELEAAFERRVEEWEPERAQLVVRQVLLRVIDEKWRDHLYELDQLKTGIQYRAWGQKDPLLEYKTEAFGMFVEMMDDLRSSATQMLFRVQIVDPGAMSAEDRRRRERIQRQQVAMHRAAPAMAGAVPGGTSTSTAGLPGPPPAASTPGPARATASATADTFVREGDKVGRNDPCPCGSGKKYKKCHGA
jgi:preprotein translocase subunit SecA